jgi:hypothetical protein
LFTRLAVAESELRAMKDVLAEPLDMLAAMKASQDELRRVHDEWRSWAERATPRGLTRQVVLAAGNVAT